MPFYDEIARIPLFFWRSSHRPGGRRRVLTQTINLVPNLLDCFGLERPHVVTGHFLLPVLDSDTSLRDTVIFGVFGAATP